MNTDFSIPVVFFDVVGICNNGDRIVLYHRKSLDVAELVLKLVHRSIHEFKEVKIEPAAE